MLKHNKVTWIIIVMSPNEQQGAPSSWIVNNSVSFPNESCPFASHNHNNTGSTKISNYMDYIH